MSLNIEILEEKKNPLIERTEIRFRIDNFGVSTPNRLDVKKKIAAMQGSDEKLTIIKKLDTHFGASYTLGKAYIYKNDIPDDWDTKFAEALAAKLAYMMSYAITQSSKVREDMRKLMYERLSEARSFDGMEGTMHWLIADEWMDSRD